MSTSIMETGASKIALSTWRGRILERMPRAGPLLFAVSILLPALLFALAAWQNWRDVLREADTRIERTLRTLMEHAVKVFETQKLVIDQVNLRLAFMDWQKEADRADLHQLLKRLADDLDQVATVTITDAAGHLRASSRAYPGDPRIEFSERDWFQALRAAGSPLPFVSRSYVGRQSAVRIFDLAARVHSADGSFRGAVAVSIDGAYFHKFYQDLEPSSDNVVLLARPDGQILVRQPETPLNVVPAGAPFFKSFARREGTAAEAKSSVDGLVRYFAYRRVGAYPVYIGYALSKDGLLAIWRANVFAYGLIAAIASIALLLVSALAMRESGRERLATRRWQQAAADLRAEAGEREKVEAHLRQSQKMEAVGQLTSGIAHDFNNMLGATIGSLDLLRHRMKPGIAWDQRAERCVDTAMEGAWRAVDLTQRLLTFSRKQVLSPRALDVNDLIAGMSDLIRRSIHEDIRIETRLAAGLWTTFADPNQLENAILNLVINAKDAMPHGGRLILETRNCGPDEPDATSAKPADVDTAPHVMIAIADTGSGMSEDVRAHAFDPFFTTKDVGKGSGLGLPQVHGFVRQSQGHVEIESALGRGTMIRIYLPRQVAALPSAAAHPPVAEPDVAPALPILRPAAELLRAPLVLVVEDEAQLRRVSAEAFRQLGYRVMEASGPSEALSWLEDAPALTLLFTDVVMPDMNGATLAERVRQLQPKVRTLFTTGYARDAIVRNGVLDPGVALIVKPFTVDQLAAKVDEVMAPFAAARRLSA